MYRSAIVDRRGHLRRTEREAVIANSSLSFMNIDDRRFNGSEGDMSTLPLPDPRPDTLDDIRLRLAACQTFQRDQCTEFLLRQVRNGESISG